MALFLAACSSGNSPSADSSDVDSIFQSLSAVIPGLDRSLVESACAAGKAEFYQISVNPSADTVMENFQEAVPCLDLNVIGGNGGELQQRFQADITQGAAPDFFESTEAGVLREHAAQGHFQNFVPASAEGIDTPDPGLWYPSYGIAMGILYGSDALSADQVAKLSTWAGVLDPALSSLHFAAASPAAGGAALTSYYMTQKENGQDFLQRMGALQITAFSGARPTAEAVSSGAADIAFPVGLTTVVQLYDTGAPVRYAIPEPMLTVQVGAGIPAAAKNPAAGKLFLTYLLSAAAQTVYSEKNGGVPANSKIPFSHRISKEPWWKLPSAKYDYDPNAVNAASDAIVSDFQKFVER